VPGLTLHASTEKVEALLKERARLLREVNKKKDQVTQARAKADREAQATLLQMAPLLARHDALVRDLAALFDELLSEGRLASQAREQVLEVRSNLVLQGILPPLSGRGDARPPHTWDDEATSGGRTEPAGESKGRPGKRSQARAAAENAQRDVASAHQPGPERRSLRELFRSLASAVHPDRAREEPDRARRTEVMKEVTRAYEAGDLARLIELESAWQSERVLAGDGDPEMRCRELTRVNRELLNQVRALTRELRDVKREARDASPGPIATLIEQGEHELHELTSVRDFVRKFRDGKISLSEFARGPSSPFASDEFIAFTLESLFAEELNAEQARAPKRRGAQPKRR
jgi:hypothetical protein